MTQFAWKPGCGSKAVPAEVVGDAVLELIATDGVASPRALLKKARPKRSPLHPLFEWDDSVAAEHYRVEQAREAIRSVRIVRNDEWADTPTFVHVKIVTDEGVDEGYVELEAAQQDAGLREFIEHEALSQLQAWRRRYGHISSFTGIAEAIDALEEPRVAVR